MSSIPPLKDLKKWIFRQTADRFSLREAELICQPLVEMTKGQSQIQFSTLNHLAFTRSGTAVLEKSKTIQQTQDVFVLTRLDSLK